MDFNFEKIKSLLLKYQERVKREGNSEKLRNSFFTELRNIGGYSKGTKKLERGTRPYFIIIGLKKEEKKEKVCYVINISDIYNGEFKYEELIAHYNYLLPTEQEAEKYLKFKRDVEILQSKLRSFEKKMEIATLFREEE